MRWPVSTGAGHRGQLPGRRALRVLLATIGTGVVTLVIVAGTGRNLQPARGQYARKVEYAPE